MGRPSKRLAMMSSVALVSALTSFTACKALDSGNDGGDPCLRYGPPASLPLQWTLAGNGTRSNCTDPLLAGAFALRTPASIPVTIDGGADGAEGAILNVEGGTPFFLQGEVRGSCLSFHTTEIVKGQPVTYQFDGVVDSTGGTTASGTFTGSGPGECSSSGSFTLR